MHFSLFDYLQNLDVDFSEEVSLDIVSALLFNVLGVLDAYGCQRLLNSANVTGICGISAQQLRLSLAKMAYVQLNMKFFMLNLIKRKCSNDNLSKYCNAFDINRNDAVLVKRCLSRRGVPSKLKKEEAIRSVDLDSISAKSFASAFDTFHRIYPEILKHIRNKTFQKLRFISISENVELYDLNMELTYKAIQSYIKLCPIDMSDGHVTAYIKRALNNHVVNMIKSHTSQKRERMKKGAKDGYGGYTFEITTLSQNQLGRFTGSDGDMEINYENLQSRDLYQEAQTLLEENISFDLILNKFGTTRKRRLFIKLISAHENEEFTEFLLRNRHITDSEDNVDFLNRVAFKKYLDVVCFFLQVNHISMQRFMQVLAESVYPERAKGCLV